MRQNAPKMKNTLPRIVTTKDLKSRSYITFYYLGKRIREYCGDAINIDLKPNTATTIKERNDLLKRLEYEYIKALDNNLYPAIIKEVIAPAPNLDKYISAQEYLDKALEKKLKSNINKKYKINLKTIHTQFIKFLTNKELQGKIEDISLNRVEDFLSQFSSSGTYYMNKRRDLGVLGPPTPDFGLSKQILHCSE